MLVYADLTLRLPSTSEHWHGPEFRDELRSWVTEAVGVPDSLEPVHDRPWSTVWRAETPAGTSYAKQNTPLQGFEAALMVELAGIATDHVVPVIAADTARGLLLTPFQGLVLGEAAGELSPDAAAALATRVVRAGAELQREVVPYADRLVGAGLVRLAPSDAPEYVQQRLDDFAALPAGDPRALSAEQAAHVTARLPAIDGQAEKLAALGLPLTLHHNDLHQWNVFEVDGRLLFFDFGDALLSDPLAVLWVPLAGLARRLECEVDDPRVLGVADAALEVWSDLAPMTELRAALPAAFSLAALSRCESWLRCLASMTDAELDEYGEAAAYWLAASAD